MMSLITINDVQIKGLTVEVKSLTVGRKQLTLSLMRQFIYEDIIDEEHMLLRGVPWGFINYFWGDKKDCSTEHYLHLIWQKNSELRRCILRKKYNDYDKRNFINYCVKEINKFNTEITDLYKGLDEDVKSLKDMEEGRREPHEWLMGNWKKNIEDYRIKINKKNAEKEERTKDYYREKNFIEEKLPKYHELITSMKDLPHFFIAV